MVRRWWLALALAGCGHAPDAPADQPMPGCTESPAGDPSKPIELQLVAAGVDMQSPFRYAGTPAPIMDGSTLAMIIPPQAGWVVYVGARATNIDPCEVEVKGVLTDTATGQVRLDARTANLLPQGDGWVGPAAADPLAGALANVPVCPNQWASTDMYSGPFGLTVQLTERSGRSASQSIKVKLACAEPQFQASCQCQCKKGYKLGELCQ